MDQIANLVIDLGIDAAEFKNEIPRIKNLLNGAASDAERSSARMQRFMERQTQAARQTTQAASSAATAASVHAQTVEKNAQAHERMAREVEKTRQRMEALSQKMREEQAQAMALAEAQDKAAAAFYRQIDSVKQASAGLQELQRIQQQIRQARNSGGIGQQDYLALISEVTAKTRVLTQAEEEATRQKVAFIRQLKEQASITDVSNEITQTVNKKLEDQSAAIQQIQKVQVDTNNNLNSMWAVKLQQMQDGRLYIAGIGAGIENTPDGMQSQVLLAADRIAMINPANGNTKPMFVGQGDQIFMNEVFLKYLTAPTITSGGNPPVFSLTPDGRLTAKNADISGSVNANAGTLNNVTINENCRVLGKLSANQIEGDLVKTVGKAFPRDSRAPERWPSGTITVRVYDDQPFDRQIVIPAVAFRGAKHERENNDIYSSCRLIVKKNGAEIYNRTALDNTLVYTGVIDMPAGRGHMTLEFSVSAWLVNDWYPTASISDLLVVVMKKSTAGITIS